jgi:RNA 2',3'-cyclic 3'-phosphodiesterase
MARDRASRPEARPLRLFIAVDIPEEIRGTLATATEPLMDKLPRARWVPPQNWHVTLKFLGSTWPRLLAWVTGTVGAVASEQRPFASALTGLGVFPSPRRARVLWAGLDDRDRRFAGITGDLDAVLEREFKKEKRAFTPHLTVARFDPPVQIPEETLAVPIEKASFAVDRLVLYRSYLQRPAPRYERVAEFGFGETRPPGR